MKIIIYNVPSLVEYNPFILKEYGIGGLENCIINLSKEFSKQKHEVICYNNHNKNEIYDNVEYRHISKYNNDKVDIFIGISSFPEKINSNIKINWIHRFADFSVEKHKDVNYNVFVSEWHKNYILTHRNLSNSKAKNIVIDNGISDCFLTNKEFKKENKIIYINHPRKGVEYLIDIFPKIKKEIKNSECYVFSGTKMWGEKDTNFKDVFNNLKNNNIKVIGQVGQKRIVEELKNSKIFLYPSTFVETFGLSIIEAMAMGCIPISSYIGNIPEIIKNEKTGFLIKGNPNEEGYQKEAASIAISILKDDYFYNMIKNNAILYANKFTWYKAAKKFEQLI